MSIDRPVTAHIPADHGSRKQRELWEIIGRAAMHAKRGSYLFSVTACCVRCGQTPEIEVGPVNDIVCLHLMPVCDCNAGFNLWPKSPSPVPTMRDHE